MCEVLHLIYIPRCFTFPDVGIFTFDGLTYSQAYTAGRADLGGRRVGKDKSEFTYPLTINVNIYNPEETHML